MAVDQEHFVHLSRPLPPAHLGFSASSAPLTVNIQPQVRMANPSFVQDPPSIHMAALVVVVVVL